MMSFRQFLTKKEPTFLEITHAPLPFGGSTRYSGNLQLPDLMNLHDPGHVPPGGFGNLNQLTQAQIDRMKYSDVDTYKMTTTLEKMASLAENAYSVASQNNPQNQVNLPIKYRLVKYDAAREMIRGLGYRGLVAKGGYPEVRPQEIDKAVQLGILVKDPAPPTTQEIDYAGIDQNEDFLAIDINKLRMTMESFRQELVHREKGFRSWGYLASRGDEILGAASAGGMVPMTKAVNPLVGR